MWLKKVCCLLLVCAVSAGCFGLDAGAVNLDGQAQSVAIERASGRFSMDGWRSFGIKLYHLRRVLTAIGTILVIAIGVSISFSESDTKDSIKVGIRFSDDGIYNADGMNFSWEVENENEYIIKFEEGSIASITLNGESYETDIKAVVLEPGETYKVNIQIPYPIARKGIK